MTGLDGYRRYAVYYAPERGSALGRFGSAWLGRDAETGETLAPPAVVGLPRPAGALAAVPCRYGFHGTLKPPFRLGPACSAGALGEAVAALARSEPAFALPPLRLASLGGFLALVPSRPTPRLDVLAARCVVELDGFRAPLSPEERTRRAEGLGAREATLLDRWGYPYVLEAFRFHLTLTGPLDDPVREATARALAPVLAPILGDGQPFSELCLFGEPAYGPFRLLRRFPLGRRS